MNLIKVSEIPAECWKIGKKTKNLKAKPLANLLVDSSVLSQFLVTTLEGREPLRQNAMICIGESNDAWQQYPKNLLKKYDVIDIDETGWLICKPKPENEVFCINIDENLVDYIDDLNINSTQDEFFVIGQWGEEIELNTKEKVQIQRASTYDFILKSKDDPTDIWIVRNRLFNNTYEIIN